jgi:hypothetical protein
MSTLTGQWYKAEDTPLNDTDQVGGAIDLANPMTGLLSELFEVGRSKALGQGYYDRFRKIFFRNEGNDVSEAVAFFQKLQHIDQLRFAFEKSADDTSTNSATMPAGYVAGDFESPVGLIEATGGIGQIPPDGTLTGLESVGMWVWQRIPEGLSPETGTLGVVRIAGNVAP